MYSDYEGRYIIQQNVVLEGFKDATCFESDSFVYEVIRVVEGRPLLFKSHIRRLMQSIELLKWPKLNGIESLNQQLKQVIALNQIVNQNIKIRVDLRKGQLFTIVYPIHSRYPSESLYQTGAKAGIFEMERTDPNAKAFTQHMLQVRTALEASDCQELLLLNHKGCITEGSKSNVVFMRGNQLHSALERDILLGITRSVLKHAIVGSSFEWIEHELHLDALENFDGAFLTGTSIHLLPLHSVKHITYATEINPSFLALKTLFLKQIEREHEEDFNV